MANIINIAAGAIMTLSAATAFAAPVAAKSGSSCYDAYGYYGYSRAYCEHDLYGRSSPADRYYGQKRESPWRDDQQFGPLANRDQNPDRDRVTAVRDREDSSHDGDRETNRDRSLATLIGE